MIRVRECRGVFCDLVKREKELFSQGGESI